MNCLRPDLNELKMTKTKGKKMVEFFLGNKNYETGWSLPASLRTNFPSLIHIVVVFVDAPL